MKKIIIASFVGSFFGFTALAQGDNCATAALITQGATCVPTLGTTSGATESMPGCAADSDADDDVWYKFVATSTIANISVLGDEMFDAVVEVFSGSCGTLTSMTCVDQSLDGEVELAAVGGLTIGQTYFIRVYDWYAGEAPTPDFAICITEPCANLTQPAGSILETEACGASSNGGCLATPTPVYQDITCGDVIWGTSWANAGSRDTDWYRFTVTTPTSVTFTVNAEFPVNVFFIDISDCEDPLIIADISSTNCSAAALTYNFTAAGTYVAFVSPAVFTGYACGTKNDYSAALTMVTTPTVLTPAGPTAICAGGSVTLSTTGSAPFAWYNGATLIPSATGATYAATAAGSYTAVSNNANGCDVTSNASTVTVTPLQDATFNYASSTLCAGGPNVTPTITTAGGTFTSTPAGLVIDASTGEINVATSTNGSYAVTYTTAGTCPGTQTNTVTVTTAPDATFTYAEETYCSGETDPVPAFGAGASGGAFTSTTGLTINATGTIDLSASTAGTYVVTNTIAASGSCPATSETFTVTINATPVVTVNSAAYCTGQSAVLTASGATTFVWTPATGLSATTGSTVTANPAATTIYTVTGVANGCDGTATSTVTVNPLPTVAIAPFTALCENGAAVTLSGATPAGGTFSGTGVTGGSFNPATAGDGTFTITYNYTDANNCAGSATAPITVNAAPTVALAPLSSLCTYNPAVTLAGGTPAGGTFSGTGVTGGSFNPATAGAGTFPILYSFTDANGCSGTATQNITVGACLSVDETIANDLMIVPNPAADFITISFTNSDNSDVLLTMISGDGKVVAARKVAAAASFNEKMDVSTLSEGVYFIQMTTNNGTVTQKVIVQ